MWMEIYVVRLPTVMRADVAEDREIVDAIPVVGEVSARLIPSCSLPSSKRHNTHINNVRNHSLLALLRIPNPQPNPRIFRFFSLYPSLFARTQKFK